MITVKEEKLFVVLESGEEGIEMRREIPTWLDKRKGPLLKRELIDDWV